MNKDHSFLSLLSVGLLLVYVSIMSAVVPWTGDDITYLFSFADGTPISSFGDIWYSQIAHWHSMNGRFLAHFIVQTVLAFVGRAGFIVLNDCAYVALVFLVLKLGRRDFDDWKSVAVVCALILLALPTKFVPTCQIGYIWMFDLVLFFVLEWEKTVIDSNDSSKWNLLWLIPLSFLAGTSQEAIVIGVGFALAVYALGNMRRLGVSGWLMFLSFGIGAMLLCLSPANFQRTVQEHGSIGNLGETATIVVKFFLYQRASYFLLFVVVYLLVTGKTNIRDIYNIFPFLWNSWASLLLFNIVIGVFGNRQLFGAEIIAVIILLRTMSAYVPKCSKLPQTIVICLVTLLVSVNAASAFHSKKLYKDIVSEYENSVDGTVQCKLDFFDRHYRESGPSDAWSWYVISSVDRLLHIDGGDENKELQIRDY